jgi:hypothetical protein
MPSPVASNSLPIRGVASGLVCNSAERVIARCPEIMADRRQLLYALTLPEYLEAWITPVDADLRYERVAMRCGTAYAIEYRDLHGQKSTIEGVFRTANLEKVMLTWRRLTPYETRQSIVTIRFIRSLASTILMLTHAGVMPDSEYLWLRDLWELSLVRLQSLIEGGRAIGFEVPPVRCSHTA